MVISTEKLRAPNSAVPADSRTLKLPNPGDVFLLVAFGWAAICMLTVVGGKRVTREAARLVANENLKQIILSEQAGIAVIMVIGIVVIGMLFAFLTRYKMAALGLFFFAMGFANASWPPLHTLAFAIKYSVIIYLGAYGLLFFVKNGWKLIDTPGHRLVCLYVGWIALMAVVHGLRTADIWYAGTEFVLMIGFGIAWLSYVNTPAELEKINRLFGYAAVVATGCHLLSLVVIETYMTPSGRFYSMFTRATGFATIYSLYVVALFWLSMFEQRPVMRRVYTGLAMLGYVLILWSGTRNATVATLIAIALLWYVFRTRIFVFALGAGMIGLSVQILLGGTDTLEALSTRLVNTGSERFELWAMYLELAAGRPILGYGPDGLAPALYGQTLTDIITTFRRIRVPGTHNHYLGFLVRFGLIGLGLFVLLFFFALRQTWRVLRNPQVSKYAKQVYVLPAALVLLVALQGLFEDNVGSTGRGTLHGVVMGLAIPIVYLFGRRLISEARANPPPQAVVSRPGQ